jgi:hypothetical protein
MECCSRSSSNSIECQNESRRYLARGRGTFCQKLHSTRVRSLCNSQLHSAPNGEELNAFSSVAFGLSRWAEANINCKLSSITRKRYGRGASTDCVIRNSLSRSVDSSADCTSLRKYSEFINQNVVHIRERQITATCACRVPKAARSITSQTQTSNYSN